MLAADLKYGIVNLADIITRVQEMAEPRLARHHIRLEASVAEGLPSVKADPTQLEMALFNLVGNAMDAMPGGGTLSIAATVHAGDDSSRDCRHRFRNPGGGRRSPVRSPGSTTKAVGRGSGLGLAIVRDVVRAHGGSIAASESCRRCAVRHRAACREFREECLLTRASHPRGRRRRRHLHLHRGIARGALLPLRVGPGSGDGVHENAP